MLSKFVQLAQEDWCVGAAWCPALEQIVNLVFNNSSQPLEALGNLVKKIHQAALAASQEEGSEAVGPAMTKLFFCVGHVALESLVYVEEFDRNVKKRRHEKEKAKAEADESKNKAEEEEDLNEELGMSEADEVHEAEMFQRIAEGKIVGPGTVLGEFTELIVTVCASEDDACDIEMRTAAIMALCKCMCISTEFCDKNLRLLFSILQNSKSARIRAMIIVALGDMASRFPNLLEPWNEKMYERLADPEVCVRKNTMLVMSHLILNDMIKARGHIAHIAMCLEDEDLRIRDIARLFWAEFSNKQNAIYNVIPDVISNLSNSTIVDQAAFQRIMKLLMSYIEKDKQSESLIKKLCHRIRDSKDQSVGKDLVFCMAQLNYTAKCIKKLVENHKCWIMLRTDKEAMSQFDVICNKAKRFAKDDMKLALTQLEAQLAGEKIEVVTSEGDAAATATEPNTEGETPKPAKAALKPSKAQNKAKGKSGKGKSAKSKVVLDSEGEDDDAVSMESEGEFEDDVVVKKGKENPKVAKSVKGTGRARRGVAA